jgi:hypothetical protein
MRRRARVAPLIVVLVVACRAAAKLSSDPVVPIPTSVVSPLDSVVLERTGGYRSPASASSRLSIARSGEIMLRVRGSALDVVTISPVPPPPILDSIARHAAAIGFDSLPRIVSGDGSLCPTQSTDNGTLVVSLFGERPKRVEYYLGCYMLPDPGAPMRWHVRPELMRLRALADAIDSLAHTAELRKHIRP